MAHLGDFDASAVIYGKFATYRPSTGATFTLGGTPALSVYKDNSATQSTAGVTLTADFDSVTGLNHYAIDTSADGTFYAAGSFFDVVITTGTVDGVSVTGSPVASFTIRKTSALKPATAGRTLVVDSNGLADANTVKIGPTGSGTAQTAKDVGAAVPAAAAGASGGLLISGSNAGTTTLGALTVTGATTLTGNVALADGLTIAVPSTTNRAGFSIAGNGSGAGLTVVGGATGNGARFLGGATSGLGALFSAQGSGSGLGVSGASNSAGLAITGGGTSGEGVIITTTSGDGVGIYAAGVSKHGIVVTGGSAGTSDGMRLVAGTGGVALRAATITGDITGSLSGSVGSVTGLTPSTIADQVWDEILSGHAVSGSTGEALSAAGGAGDPWITALPGSYSAGQAGKIVGDYLNASVSSRATQTSVDDLPTNAELATALGTADDAVLAALAALTIPTATQNADALLNRDMAAVSDTNARSPLNALRFIRNKWDVAAGTLTVKKEDDSTTAWTAAVSTSAGADPIVGNDPA